MIQKPSQEPDAANAADRRSRDCFGRGRVRLRQRSIMERLVRPVRVVEREVLVQNVVKMIASEAVSERVKPAR